MTLIPPATTALMAGALLLMQMALLLRVVVLRRRNRQSMGDGGNTELLAAIRCHGNFAENAGIFVACFALLEMLGGGGIGLSIMCVCFALGRLSHAIGLSLKQSVNPLRVGGIVVTVGVGLMLGGRLIHKSLPLLGG